MDARGPYCEDEVDSTVHIWYFYQGCVSLVYLQSGEYDQAKVEYCCGLELGGGL